MLKSKPKKKNHWDFLEEIEAPMWLDLDSELDSSKQDVDDDWFNTSHLFHQRSSRELKIVFSHSGKEGTGLDFDLLELSSPKLPSSVSKLRGKHYVSKEWGGDNQAAPIDNQHPVSSLSGSSSCGTSESGNNMNTRPSCAHLKGTSRSKSSWASSSSIGNDIPSCADSMSTLTSTDQKACESNTVSTITHTSILQQQPKMVQSSNTLSQASALLSLVKTGTRKSCGTRKAVRVEITSDTRPLRGHSSSSGKSSIGSSSNPYYDAISSTSTSTQYKEKTPDIRNMSRISTVTKNKVQISQASKTSSKKIEQGASNYRKGPNTVKSTCQQAAKPKVQGQTLRRKPLGPAGVNESKLITATVKSKDRPVVFGSYRLATSGTENCRPPAESDKKENIVKVKAAGNRTQKCNSKGLAGGTIVTGLKAISNIAQGHVRIGLARKDKIVENRFIGMKDITKRPHFR